MIFLIPRWLKPEWARAPANIFSNQRSWRGPTLGCLLLAGCVTSGETPSPTASDPNALPKAEPAVVRFTEAPQRNEVAAAVAATPETLQRRRQAIAVMLERNFDYRTLYDVKLVNAQLAGPFEYTEKSLFTSASWKSTLYCTSVQLDLPLIPITRTAVFRVKQSSDGFEVFVGRKPSPFECANANFGPFPELEQARAKRRQALGKAD